MKTRDLAAYQRDSWRKIAISLIGEAVTIIAGLQQLFLLSD
jgi:hypothetical protein